MSAPYPTEEKSAYPVYTVTAPDPSVAPPSYDGIAYPLTQPENQDEAGHDQKQAYPQQRDQSSTNTVIVTQPQTPIVTYPMVPQRKYTGVAVGALMFSILACLFTFWPIGLIAVIFASKFSSE